MPVPVSVSESLTVKEVKEEAKDLPSLPSTSTSETAETAEGGTTDDPCVVAGYEDCLRETIRFLVHDEKLPEEHPLVAGLNFHLASDTAHKELMRVSSELAKKLSEELRSSLEEDEEEDSGMESSFSDEEEQMPLAQAYKITLEEDDGNSDEEIVDEDYCMEEDMSDDEGAEDIITSKDILSHPYLRNELIKLVFQGCDLVTASTLQS
ncbi:UNVERIFIED_CONTAM: hypothetical protein RMT77_009046 [Armadillidium vulgare]|nr:hypothetical protein Avbf_08102 [Armadillidium vulgare]